MADSEGMLILLGSHIILRTTSGGYVCATVTDLRESPGDPDLCRVFAVSKSGQSYDIHPSRVTVVP